MEEFVQFSAKNKSEAITKACMELGTSSDQLDIRIISEGSSGFFGIGAKPAVIKARRKIEVNDNDEIKDILDNVKIESIRKPEKKEAPKKENKKPEKKAPVKEKPPVKENKAAEEKKPVKKEAAKQDKKEVKKEAPAEEKATAEKTAEPVKEAPEKEAAVQNQEKQPKEKNGRERNRRKHDRAQEKSEKTEKPEVEEGASEDTEKSAKPVRQSKPIEILTDEAEIQEVEQKAADFLKKVFETIDLGEVQIKSVYNREEGSLDVDFEGDDMGVLIGKRGQTLDSLQYLTSLVVNKGKDNYIRVKLDTEDYRRRRKETLENLARGIAYKVKKTRRPVVLEPMNPYERRIIHSSLQGNKYVETISEGEEPYRHIVVKLKRN